MANVTGSLRVESFPFDSKADGYDADGYPVYDRAVGALTLRTVFRQFFTDGVFGTPADALEISKGDGGLRVNVAPGVFIIRGAMARVGDGDKPVTLTLSDTPPQGNVAYGIMLHYDENDTASIGRSLSLVAVAGEASSSAQPPAPDQSTPGICEYRLGYVTVPSGATDLSGATVTNEKGTSVCPYTAPFESLDLSEVVNDAREQAQEVTDAFLTYAQQYYDVVAGALDGTEVGKLMDLINAINVYSFVDNVTTQVNASGKIEVKDNGISGEKIQDYAVSQNHLDNFLRQRLGLLDTDGWGFSEYKGYVSALTTESDQTDFIQNNVTSEIIEDWTAAQVVEFDGILKGTTASNAMLNLVVPDDWPWADLSTIAGGAQGGSALVGKGKSAACGTLGTLSFIIIGVRHDSMVGDSDDKAPLTFMASKTVGNDISNDDNAWPSSNLRTYLTETVWGQLPSDLQTAVKTVTKTYSSGSCFGSSTTNLDPDTLSYATSSETVFALAASEISSQPWDVDDLVYYKTPSDGSRYEFWEKNPNYNVSVPASYYGSRSLNNRRFVLGASTNAANYPGTGTGKGMTLAFCI